VNLLLDTHALIWFVAGDRRLGPAARAAMEQEQARLFISAASVWEMAIKAARGRLVLPCPVARYLTDRIEEGYALLRVDGSHAAAVEHLPFHHHDPFDRLLVAQALSERLPVITRDRVFKKYGVEVIW
jgi:PIN domain nuclease of toxin-antitoxin system